MDTELWDFAVRLYSQPGVADACIALQDECEVDVPILLFAAWLTKHSAPIAEEDLTAIDALIREWRSVAVQSLRNLRRWLKGNPLPNFQSSVEILRQHVKIVELQSEKIELAVLEKEGRRLMEGGARSGDPNRNCLVTVGYFLRREPDVSCAQNLAVVQRALRDIS